MAGPVGKTVGRLAVSFECSRNLHDFCHVRKRGKDGEPHWRCPCSCHKDDDRVLKAEVRKRAGV